MKLGYYNLLLFLMLHQFSSVMIAVNACIIHEVLKEAKIGDIPGTTTIDPSKTLLDPANEFVIQLLASIHKSFGDDSALRNTHFEKDQSTVFSTNLTKYLSSNKEEDFFSFSEKSIKALKTLIEKVNFAVGGYYVFGDYTIDGRRFISVMVVRKNKQAINFKKVNNVIVPARAENIDTEKIAMGFRLNFNLYESSISRDTAIEDEKNYIALLAGQQDRQLSGYFKDWVNAAGIISNEKNSTSFIEIIKSIDLPKDEHGNEIFTREEFKRKAFTYAEESRNKIININAFSAFVYGETEVNRIMNFASAQGITLDPEFKRSSNVFKRLITIHARIPGIELNIDYDKLNENEVHVQANRIVIKSKQLVEQINAQK